MVLASAVSLRGFDQDVVAVFDAEGIAGVVAGAFVGDEVAEDEVVFGVREDNIFADAGGIGAGIAGRICAAGIEIKRLLVVVPAVGIGLDVGDVRLRISAAGEELGAVREIMINQDAV